MPAFIEIQRLISLLIQSINFNFIDIIILAVLIFYAFEAYFLGFIGASFDFASFVLSFALGLKFYGFFGQLLVNNFSMPKGFANASGFFIAAFIAELIASFVFRKLYAHLFTPLPGQKESTKSILINPFFQKANHILGLLPGIASAFLLSSFLLTIIISLPFSPFLKHAVSSSRIGSMLVSNAAGFEKKINDVFGGAVSETLNFLTIKPEGDEFVNLNFKTSNFSIDLNAERKMFFMINKERASKGLPLLVFDDKLREIAIKHSEDMFVKGYFSHNTPEGLSPFDRMAEADIAYLYAGENLALAPNIDIAMQGLMNSKGHRANILSSNFGKIGIGVIDGGIYGEMFSQEFTN